MPLGRKAGLSPSVIVLDGDPATLPLKGRSPPPANFRPMSIVANGRPSQLVLGSCSKMCGQRCAGLGSDGLADPQIRPPQCVMRRLLLRCAIVDGLV